MILGAYFFGGISVVKHNFTLVIVAIVIISVLPMVIKALSNRKKRRAAEAAAVDDDHVGLHYFLGECARAFSLQ